MSYEHELAVITKAVRAGGSLARKMRQQLSAEDVSVKQNPKDILTVADPAVQELITEQLRQEFPGITIIGEEGATLEEQKKAAQADRFWVIDPIDGTTNYSHGGSPRWGTTACLVQNDEPVAGVIYLPDLDILLTASKDNGCYGNGLRMTKRVSSPSLGEAVVGLEWHYLSPTQESKLLTITRAVLGTHANLSAVYNIYSILIGEIDAYINVHEPDRGACIWDFAAGHLMMQELVSPEDRNRVAVFPDGRPLSYRGQVSMEAILSPFPDLVEEIVTITR